MPDATEYRLPGVRTQDITLLPDDRGFFAEVFRQDWQSLLGEDRISQANLSYSYPGMIRAWHQHLRGQVDYYLVVQGALKICAYDETEGPTRGQLVELVAHSRRPQLVRVPGFYWHGIKTISSEPSLTLYFVTHMYDYASPDEGRRPWNDPAILDPRTGEPYDWNRPPHK